MRRTVLRALVPVAIAAGIVAMSAGGASAATKCSKGLLAPSTCSSTEQLPTAGVPGPVDLYPTVQSNWDSWNLGGAMLGGGAAHLLAAAWDGAPQSIIANIKRIGAPYLFSNAPVQSFIDQP